MLKCVCVCVRVGDSSRVTCFMINALIHIIIRCSVSSQTILYLQIVIVIYSLRVNKAKVDTGFII